MELRQWLVRQGWQVLEESDEILRVRGDISRLVEEADQLLRDLQSNFGIVFDPGLKAEDGFAASIRAYYDPSTGEAVIEITAAG